MNTTIAVDRRSGFVYDRALRGVSMGMVCLLAPVTAPMTGEVRPLALDSQATHLGNGVKDNVRVRSWSPPV